ncbi:MAG: hypothetical protein QM759_07465 [Terricaulis sp.]
MSISYRFEPDYTIEGRHYEHPLVSWPTIFAGAIAAIAIGFVLNVLGLAIGASVFNPYQSLAHHETIGAVSGLYMIFAQFVAFQIAGYIATRSARFPDHFGGALNGFLVWALAVVFAVALASLAGSFAASGADVSDNLSSVVNNASDAATNATGSSGQLENADDSAKALAAVSWWIVGALGLGLAGAIAGGWLGAHHPKWESRPRLDDRAAYKMSPEI